MEVRNLEKEMFYDFIKVNAEGVLRITIPSKFAAFTGLKEGDKVKVWIEKLERKEDDNEKRITSM